MTPRRTAGLLLVLIAGLAVHAWCATTGSATTNRPQLDPDFWMSVSVNAMGTGLFLTRVLAPESSRWFGYGTQLLGIPSLVLAVTDIAQGVPDLSTWGNLGYAAWALGAALLDHVFRIEYRDPVRPELLLPYVATYYAAIGFQAAVLLDKDVVTWAIAGAACIVNVAASFYARGHENV